MMPNSKNIFINKVSDFKDTEIILPASKSIANRALVIRALSGGNNVINNLSEARDTQTMHHLLQSDSNELDVLDAGTTMRFLTAYFAITNKHKILTGSDRMKERPIKLLVDALTSLGANIKYINKEGYPPIELIGFRDKRNRKIKIKGNVSSQYISALLMIGPLLKEGLELNLIGKIGSRPYIDMTLAVMRSYGVESNFIKNKVIIEPQNYKCVDYSVEPDWSAASYWYSLVALSNDSIITLKGLGKNSIQGDSVIRNIMHQLGVDTVFSNDGVTLIKKPKVENFSYDFTDCPDLAQTIAVICAVNGIYATLTGLESLKIKETDRVTALQNELKKLNCEFIEEGNKWYLTSGKLSNDPLLINTYDDHRMAMAFAPICLKSDITIENASVVNKSYPNFWQDFKSVGLIPHEV